MFTREALKSLRIHTGDGWRLRRSLVLATVAGARGGSLTLTGTHRLRPGAR